MNTIKVNCLIGDIVFKMCPKCNENHNVTCENCAWSGCIWQYCSIDPYIYSDGSHLKGKKQVVEKVVKESSFIHINELWNVGYFATRDDCEKAINEYEAICAIEDKKMRVAEFEKWYNTRKTDVTFER